MRQKEMQQFQRAKKSPSQKRRGKTEVETCNIPQGEKQTLVV